MDLPHPPPVPKRDPPPFPKARPRELPDFRVKQRGHLIFGDFCFPRWMLPGLPSEEKSYAMHRVSGHLHFLKLVYRGDAQGIDLSITHTKNLQRGKEPSHSLAEVVSVAPFMYVGPWMDSHVFPVVPGPQRLVVLTLFFQHEGFSVIWKVWTK